MININIKGILAVNIQVLHSLSISRLSVTLIHRSTHSNYTRTSLADKDMNYVLVYTQTYYYCSAYSSVHNQEHY